MNVYWSSYAIDKEGVGSPFIKYYDPVSLFELTTDLKFAEKINDYRLCPAFQDYAKNTFALKFPFDYNLSFANNRVSANQYDQKFFDHNFQIRSIQDRQFTINSFYLFKTEQPVMMECFGSFFSDNDFNKKSMLIPGRFDIGRWFRLLECAFTLREGVSSLEINRGDVYAFVRFNTDEPVTLKKFYVTDKIIDIHENCKHAKQYNKKSVNPLSYYYNMFKESKLNNTLMKEIKENIME